MCSSRIKFSGGICLSAVLSHRTESRTAEYSKSKRRRWKRDWMPLLDYEVVLRYLCDVCFIIGQNNVFLKQLHLFYSKHRSEIMRSELKPRVWIEKFCYICCKSRYVTFRSFNSLAIYKNVSSGTIYFKLTANEIFSKGNSCTSCYALYSVVSVSETLLFISNS